MTSVDEATLTATQRDLLDADGYLVIPGVIPAEVLPEVMAHVERMIEQAPSKDPMWRPRETMHLDGFLNEGPLFDPIWMHPTLLAAAAHLLGPEFFVSGMDYRAPSPGHGSQKLHALGVGAEMHVVMTVMVALVDFTPVNGATRVIPGSHLLRSVAVPELKATPHPDERIVTCPAGSAIAFTEALTHSGTENRSTERRHALRISYARRGLPIGHNPIAITDETLDRLGNTALLLIP